MIDFDIKDEFLALVDIERLIHVVLFVLNHEAIQEEVEISVVLGDDDMIRTLNRDYLGSDTPTDVLSFPSEEINPESGFRYLGDIMISVPRAQEQAGISNHPLSAEIELLLVHAVLHLLGFDHGDLEEKQIMWAEQTEILKKLDTPLNCFPE